MKEIKPESAEAKFTEWWMEQRIIMLSPEIVFAHFKRYKDSYFPSQPSASLQGESVFVKVSVEYELPAKRHEHSYYSTSVPVIVVDEETSSFNTDRYNYHSNTWEKFNADITHWLKEVPLSTLKGVEGNEDIDAIFKQAKVDAMQSAWKDVKENNIDYRDVYEGWYDIHLKAQFESVLAKLNSPVQGNVWVKELLDNCVQEQMQGRAYMKPGMRLDNKDLVAVYENAIYQFKERLSETPLTEDKQI